MHDLLLITIILFAKEVTRAAREAKFAVKGLVAFSMAWTMYVVKIELVQQ